MIKLVWSIPGASDDDLTILHNVVKESAFSEVGALVKSQFSSFAEELDKLFATQSWNIRGHHITNPTNSEFIREISQNRHTFAALFDPPKMGNLMAPVHVVSKKSSWNQVDCHLDLSMRPCVATPERSSRRVSSVKGWENTYRTWVDDHP